MKDAFAIRRSQPASRLGELALTAGLLLPLLAGCPGSLEGTFPPPLMTGSGGSNGSGGTGVCDAPGTLFMSNNTCGGCHDGPKSSSPDLTTTNPAVWTRLVSKPATLGTTCLGMNLVNPSKPADGALLKRLTGTTCGVQMPFLSAPDQAAIDCITSWVNSQLP